MNEIKFKVAFQHEFKKHLKKIIKSGQYNIADFDLVYELLIRDIPLPARYNDHPLINRKPERECHIKPDWLLIISLMPISSNLLILGHIQVYLINLFELAFKVAEQTN